LADSAILSVRAASKNTEWNLAGILNVGVAEGLVPAASVADGVSARKFTS
jgi:hypothetical protein